MTQKTYPQTVARVFEIVGYILLLPAILGVFFAFASLPQRPLTGALMFAVLLVGFVLLVGYKLHARGLLDEKYVSSLWVATAILNSFLLLPCLYSASKMLQTSGFRHFNGEISGFKIVYFGIVVAMVFGYLSMVLFSLQAFSLEEPKKMSSSPTIIGNP